MIKQFEVNANMEEGKFKSCVAHLKSKRFRAYKIHTGLKFLSMVG